MRWVLVLLAVFGVLTLTWAVPMPKDHESFFDPTILKIEEEKYLGKRVADVEFTDEQGRTRKLLDHIKGHPTALILGYYTCDSACPLIIKNAIEASKNISKDFRGIVLSFDKEDTLKDLQEFKKKLGISPSSHWTFGIMKEEDIKKLSQSLGYRFFYSRQDRVFVHPNVVIFIDPEGKISRYLYGISPREKDFRIALAEAETFRITKNTIVDIAFMVCYKYDPNTGKYGLNPVVLFAIAGFTLGSLTLAYAFIKRVKEAQP